MRVAVVTGSISRKAGGLFTSVRRLVQQINSMGIEVAVHAIRDEFSQDDANLWNPVPVRILRGKGPSALGFAPGLRKAVESFRPQVIQVHGLWKITSLSAMGASRQRACPHVVHTHGMLDPWALRNSGWKKKLAGLLFEWEHLRRAACIRALNASEAESIRAFGLKNPIAIVPNGVDLPQEAGECQLSGIELPRSDSQSKTPRTLLFLGRIHPKKGIAELIEAWKLSRARLNGWELKIAGWDDGSHEAGLRARVSRLGLQDSVKWTGPLFGKAKASALQWASAFILPSFSEGLPIAPLEAWAYGKPVLITPQCNIPEGFSADAGIQIEPNSDSIAGGLDRLARLSNADLNEMGSRGRRLVKEKFAWPQIAAEMKAVYEWVLGNGAKPQCVVL